MNRRIALAAATLVVVTGCTARTTDLPGAYTEGGYGTRFYAEVPYAKAEGQKPRIYLFGKLADFDKFIATKEVPEAAHKKFIAKGEHRETIVVQDLVGFELKDDPRYTDKLLAKYQARHGLNGPAPASEPVAEATAAPSVAPAAAPAAK